MKNMSLSQMLDVLGTVTVTTRFCKVTLHWMCDGEAQVVHSHRVYCAARMAVARHNALKGA